MHVHSFFRSYGGEVFKQQKYQQMFEAKIRSHYHHHQFVTTAEILLILTIRSYKLLHLIGLLNGIQYPKRAEECKFLLVKQYWWVHIWESNHCVWFVSHIFHKTLWPMKKFLGKIRAVFWETDRERLKFCLFIDSSKEYVQKISRQFFCM